jgi:hypothetical protein
LVRRELVREPRVQSWRVFEGLGEKGSSDQRVRSIMAHRRDRAKIYFKVGGASTRGEGEGEW